MANHPSLVEPLGFEKCRRGIGVKNSNHTSANSSLPARNSVVARDETAAASERGYPKAPVEIDGKAIVDRPWSTATV